MSAALVNSEFRAPLNKHWGDTIPGIDHKYTSVSRTRNRECNYHLGADLALSSHCLQYAAVPYDGTSHAQFNVK